MVSRVILEPPDGRGAQVENCRKCFVWQGIQPFICRGFYIAAPGDGRTPGNWATGRHVGCYGDQGGLLRFGGVLHIDGTQVGKPAIQQTGKSAVRGRRCGGLPGVWNSGTGRRVPKHRHVCALSTIIGGKSIRPPSPRPFPPGEGEWSAVANKLRAFPLTPALSLRERGNIPPTRKKAKISVAIRFQVQVRGEWSAVEMPCSPRKCFMDSIQA